MQSLFELFCNKSIDYLDKWHGVPSAGPDEEENPR